MADSKMTIAQKFEAITNELKALGSTLTLDGESYDVFLANRAEKSVKKSSGVRKVSAEKQELRDTILAFIEENPGCTCGDIAQHLLDTTGTIASTSLISGNLKGYIDNGTVIKGKSGKITVYSLATPTEDVEE